MVTMLERLVECLAQLLLEWLEFDWGLMRAASMN